jgi:hypothetical protein
VREFEPVVRRVLRARLRENTRAPGVRLDGHLPVGDGQLLRARRGRPVRPESTR